MALMCSFGICGKKATASMRIIKDPIALLGEAHCYSGAVRFSWKSSWLFAARQQVSRWPPGWHKDMKCSCQKVGNATSPIHCRQSPSVGCSMATRRGRPHTHRPLIGFQEFYTHPRYELTRALRSFPSNLGNHASKQSIGIGPARPSIAPPFLRTVFPWNAPNRAMTFGRIPDRV